MPPSIPIGPSSTNVLDFLQQEEDVDEEDVENAEPVGGEENVTEDEIIASQRQAREEGEWFRFLGDTGRIATERTVGPFQPGVRKATGLDERENREALQETTIEAQRRYTDYWGPLGFLPNPPEWAEYDDGPVASTAEAANEVGGGIAGQDFVRQIVGGATGVDPYGSAGGSGAGGSFEVQEEGGGQPEPTGGTGYAANLGLPFLEVAVPAGFRGARAASRLPKRLARGEQAMSISGLFRVGRRFSDEAAQVIRRGGDDVSQVDEVAEGARRTVDDGSLSGLTAGDIPPAARLDPQDTRRTETAFEESFDRLDDIDTGVSRTIDNLDFGPRTTSEAASGVGTRTGARSASSLPRQMQQNIDEAITAFRTSDEFAAGTGRAADDLDDFVTGASRAADDSAAGASRAGDDLAEQTDEPAGLVDQIRQTFFGSRARTGATAVGGTVAGGAAGMSFLGGGGGAAGIEHGEYRYEIAGSVGPRAGPIVEIQRADNGEVLGYAGYVDNWQVLTPDPSTVQASISMNQLRAAIEEGTDVTGSRLEPRFDTSSGVRRAYAALIEEGNAGGGDDTPAATDWDGNLNAPSSISPGDRPTIEASVQNASDSRQSATIAIVAYVDGSPESLGQRNFSLDSGGSGTMSVRGGPLARLPPAEYRLGLVTVGRGGVEATLDEVTVTVGEGGGQDGGTQWNEPEIVQELQGGLYLIRRTDSAGEREQYAVVGRTEEGSYVFLGPDGNTRDGSYWFDSAEEAMQAYQRWTQRQRNGNASGPQPSPSAPRPDMQDIKQQESSGGGLLTPVNIAIGAVAVVGIWYVSDGKPIQWVESQVNDAVDTISNIGG